MKKSTIKLFLLIALIFFGIWLTNWSPYAGQFTSQNIQQKVESYGVLSPIAFLIFFIVGTLLSVPTAILIIVASLLFKLVGFLYVMIGVIVCAALCYYIGLILGHEFVHKHLDGKYHHFCNIIRKHTFKEIFVLRLLPVPFPTLSYISGAVRLPFKQYYTASILGIIPPIFLYSWLFTNLGEALLDQRISFALLLEKNILIPFSILVILTLAVAWINRPKHLKKTKRRKKR